MGRGQVSLYVIVGIIVILVLGIFVFLSYSSKLDELKLQTNNKLLETQAEQI